MAEKSKQSNGKGSGRGGRREGAGRKPGKANEKTRLVSERILEERLASNKKQPLEVMLDNMEFALNEAGDLMKKIIEMKPGEEGGMDALKSLLRLRSMAQECAKDAAPYVHPRLSSVEHSGSLAVSHEQALAALAAAEEQEDEEDHVVTH